MAQAAKLCLEFEPQAIDINMGCPAPKVANNGAGSALMKTRSWQVRSSTRWQRPLTCR